MHAHAHTHPSTTVLDKNRIKFVDVDGFSGLTNLRELRLEENGLRSLSNFTLPNLQSLYLGLNRVNDMAELDKLSSIPFLMELNMASNPLARKQLYRANSIRRLPTLKFVDGREVTYEERERVELMFVTDTRTMPHSLFYVDNQQHSLQQGKMQMGYAHIGQQLGHQGNLTNAGTGTGGGMGGPRVPVKLTSVNFESLTGFARNGNALAAAASAAANAANAGVNQQHPEGLLPSVGNLGRNRVNIGRRTSAGSLMVNPSNAYQARRPDTLSQAPLGHRQVQSNATGRSSHVWRINRG